MGRSRATRGVGTPIVKAAMGSGGGGRAGGGCVVAVRWVYVAGFERTETPSLSTLRAILPESIVGRLEGSRFAIYIYIYTHARSSEFHFIVRAQNF